MLQDVAPNLGSVQLPTNGKRPAGAVAGIHLSFQQLAFQQETRVGQRVRRTASVRSATHAGVPSLLAGLIRVLAQREPEQR